MNCLKCGRETSDDHVFCDQCRKTMEKYPVRPGTAVILPHRKESTVMKKPRRHGALSPQDQIRKLKKQRTALWVFVLCLVLALSAAAAAITHLYRVPNFRPGQNYVVETTSAAK